MNYVIAILNLIVIIFLFRKAAGNLKISSLNVISYVFYSLLIFEFLGMSIIYCGFNSHYTISLINNNREVINKTYLAMTLAMYILPIFIIIFNRYVYKIVAINKRYREKNSSEVSDIKNTNKMFYICVTFLVISFISMVYVFSKIGYIPLLKFFDKGFDFAKERINSGRLFTGNVYIKNLVMLLLTPLISYISYIYMRTTKEKRWIILFIISFIMCVFVKTYDFSKAPVVYYCLYFFIIEVMLGNIKSFKKVIPYVIGGCALILVMYFTVAKYNGKLLSLSTGPLSRLTISQPGSLLLHFDAFPEKTQYLNGHSFPSFSKVIFGEGEYRVRSGRKVMELYNPKGVSNGTAGVMSTMFIGEAYANFGWYGVVISPIIVAFVFSSIMCIYLKSKKTVLNMCLYLEAIMIFVNVLQAGVVEFIYNVSFVCVVIYIIFMKYLYDHKYFVKIYDKIKNRNTIINKKEKRMIFHVPNYLDTNSKSGSSIRPFKMIKAFENTGYKVDSIMGYASRRQDVIEEIEENIINGVKYDFLYSESSTMPTSLTEKHHLPTHPFLDFCFFKFCKRHNIKIGLFYRDIYWKYDVYKDSVSPLKRTISTFFYKYDLCKYNKLLNILYLPSLKMAKVVYKDKPKMIVKQLPPGISKNSLPKNNSSNGLNLFYVGGITDNNGLYDLTKLMKIVSIDKKIQLTICCRKDEWDKVESYYDKLLNSQIRIIHKQGNELSKYYNEASLCSLIFPFDEYRSFAMPIKLFEYLSYGKPVITTSNSAVSDFVKEKDVGFIVEYDDASIEKEIKKILSDKKLLSIKRKNIEKVMKNETWEERARQVENDLKGIQ